MNQEAYTASVKQALKVEFLSNSEELHLYIKALYSAMMWGMGNNNKDLYPTVVFSK